MSGQQIVVAPDQFGLFRVHEMRENEWYLGSATPTSIKSLKAHIILFYEPQTVDPALIDIWNLLAQTVAGPVIAAVNMSARAEVMDAFMAVQADVDNPLWPFTGFNPPAIIAYRNRWPQAFYPYDLALSYNSIKLWISKLACKPGYRNTIKGDLEGVVPIGEDLTSEQERISMNYPNEEPAVTDPNDVAEQDPEDFYDQQEQEVGTVDEDVEDVGYLDD